MDIDKILHTKVEVNNDREKLTAYNLSRGPSYSLNENLVPEQLFDNLDTEEKEADGISATKALSLAAQQGQTIYTITKANYAEVLPKLNHSDVVMTDIRNGINAGKTVTVHDTQIRLNGWQGTGYTILDPNSGAGAYMIGGGLDGGFTAVPGIQKILSVVGLGYVYIRLLAILGNSLPDFLSGMARSIFLLSHILNIVNLANNCNSALITRIVIIGMTILTMAIIGLLFVFAAPAIVGLLSLFAVGYFNSKLVSATINTSACQRE